MILARIILDAGIRTGQAIVEIISFNIRHGERGDVDRVLFYVEMWRGRPLNTGQTLNNGRIINGVDSQNEGIDHGIIR